MTSYGGRFKVLNILHRVLNTRQNVRHNSGGHTDAAIAESAPKSVALRGFAT